jgi:hypothetical protein
MISWPCTTFVFIPILLRASPPLEKYCSGIRLSQEVVAWSSGVWGVWVALLVADLDEVVDELVMAEQTTGQLAHEARTTALTPLGEAARFAAGFGKSSWQRLQAPAQDQLYPYRVLEVCDE